MDVLISGVTGLVGGALTRELMAAGHRVTGLSRARGTGNIHWNPETGELEATQLEGFDAVVHLAGESIASGRWTAAKKANILESRVRGTRLLADALAKLQRRPRVFVIASAIGYYGHRPGEELNEASASGEGFLAEVCRQWEAAADTSREAGIRTIHTRFGMVLSPEGGALQPLLLTARLGLAGPIGDGRQIWSWVALDDVAGALVHVLTSPDLEGAVNVVAPKPVPQREFAAVFGRVLKRPAFMPLPAFAARLVLGEMADELLLPSQDVRPAKLAASGYRFRFPELEPALHAILGPARS
jgi:uncharacterized protein (TIGR01777 family)